MGNVPVHIGASELKVLLHSEIAAKFTKSLELENLPHFPIGLDDVELCDKNGVPTDMRLQKDVISDHFYKKDNKGNTSLKPNALPIIVQLRVSLNKPPPSGRLTL